MKIKDVIEEARKKLYPADFNFKLTKLKIKEGHSSVVRAGEYATAKKIHLKEDHGEPKLNRESILEIEEGHSILVYENNVNMIKTSKIIKILDRSNDHVQFETETSLYLLEAVNVMKK